MSVPDHWDRKLEKITAQGDKLRFVSKMPCCRGLRNDQVSAIAHACPNGTCPRRFPRRLAPPSERLEHGEVLENARGLQFALGPVHLYELHEESPGTEDDREDTKKRIYLQRIAMQQLKQTVEMYAHVTKQNDLHQLFV